MTNQRVLNISYFIFCKILHSLALSSLPYLNSLISEFFQHYETSMEADDVFLHGRNIVMCSHAPSKTTFYKFPLLDLAGIHQREVFLFNDILVITKIHSRKKNTVTYAFRQSHLLAAMQVNLFETQFYPYGIQEC